MASKNNRGRPAQLTQAEIVRVALEIGYPDLSMHKVAKQLGVSATALYRHVANKEELITCCAEHLFSCLEFNLLESWEESIYQFARDLRSQLLSIEGSVHFIRHNTQLLPSLCDISEKALTQLKEDNFSSEGAFMTITGVTSHVTDMVMHQERSNAGDSDPLYDIDYEKLPNLMWALSNQNLADHEYNFEQGLKIIIEGIKSLYLN